VDICAVLAIYEIVAEGIFAICHIEVLARVLELEILEYLEKF